MFDKKIFHELLEKYKKNFNDQWWEDEKYKWEAIKTFQDNWDVDDADFADMLEWSLVGTGNLLISTNHFPAKVITELAKWKPEAVRSMFKELFSEQADIYNRINTFKAKSKSLGDEYKIFSGKDKFTSYQDENSISIYLWLRFPDKYYIYKYGIAAYMAKALCSNYKFTPGDFENNIRNFYKFYDELCAELKQDANLETLLKKKLTNDCYPDPQLRTMTGDFGFYVSKYGEKNTKSYWWLTASPDIWSFGNQSIGDVQFYTLYNKSGNKRRIFKNFLDAKKDDHVIVYEATPTLKIVGEALVSAEQDGEKIVFKKIKNFTNQIDLQTVKSTQALKKMEFLMNPNGSFFKLTQDEYKAIIDLTNQNIKPYDFLSEVFLSPADYDLLTALIRRKKNVILQGAPGVGKTFASKRLAWAMMGEKDESRVGFVQFHQSYSYEDFIMGYKPTAGGGFELRRGLFHNFCQKAAADDGRDYFLIIDEINRGNLSKIFGEALMLIEADKRGEAITLASGSDGERFSVPANLFIIGLMNTADRSLAIIDYALRRRFSFFDMKPAFDSEGFKNRQKAFDSAKLDNLVELVKSLNAEIAGDESLGQGFCLGHSYFCEDPGTIGDVDGWLRQVVDYDLIPTLGEYWFDKPENVERWAAALHGALE